MTGNNRRGILSWTETGIQEMGEELFSLERIPFKIKHTLGTGWIRELKAMTLFFFFLQESKGKNLLARMEIQEWEKLNYLYNRVSYVSPTFNLCIAKYALKRQGSKCLQLPMDKTIESVLHTQPCYESHCWWLGTQWQDLEKLPWLYWGWQNNKADESWLSKEVIASAKTFTWERKKKKKTKHKTKYLI